MGEIRPILFNTDMVRAILDGRKHTTRRIANRIPVETHRIEDLEDGTFECHWGGYQTDTGMFCDGACTVSALYQIGDILYVRETWNICNMDKEDNSMTFIYRADEPAEEKTARTVNVSDAVYEKYELSMAENNPEWRPSIHMPKEAARIWLKVTDVRVERLQDIDDDGIVSEGLEIGCDFENIWNATIKKSDLPHYGWDANPWVWVIEFKRCKKPEKWMEE